jgi:hypothetical protein
LVIFHQVSKEKKKKEKKKNPKMPSFYDKF